MALWIKEHQEPLTWSVGNIFTVSFSNFQNELQSYAMCRLKVISYRFLLQLSATQKPPYDKLLTQKTLSKLQVYWPDFLLDRLWGVTKGHGLHPSPCLEGSMGRQTLSKFLFPSPETIRVHIWSAPFVSWRTFQVPPYLEVITWFMTWEYQYLPFGNSPFLIQTQVVSIQPLAEP